MLYDLVDKLVLLMCDDVNIMVRFDIDVAAALYLRQALRVLEPAQDRCLVFFVKTPLPQLLRRRVSDDEHTGIDRIAELAFRCFLVNVELLMSNIDRCIQLRVDPDDVDRRVKHRPYRLDDNWRD